MVVNFDLPIDQSGRADCETYLHRIGRTGRFGKSGVAINLVDGPRSMQVLQQIEQHFSKFGLLFSSLQEYLQIVYIVPNRAANPQIGCRRCWRDWKTPQGRLIADIHSKGKKWAIRSTNLIFLPLIRKWMFTNSRRKLLLCWWKPLSRKTNKRYPKRFCAF